MTGWLRMEKRNRQIIVYRKPDKSSGWEKWTVYEADWLNGELQVGLTVMARFAEMVRSRNLI
ncbi:MAG: hypothetical protein WDM78_06380 [Puia sp.]